MVSYYTFCSKLFFVVVLFFAFFATTSAATIARPVANSGLMGYWNFEEGAGGNVYDRSGRGNTGTLINSPVWVNGATSTGQALSFNGSTQLVTIPDSGSLRPNSVTISAWFYLTSVPNPVDCTGGLCAAIISKAYNGPPWTSPYLSWLIRVNNSTSIEFSVSNGTTYSGYQQSVGTLVANRWYHISLTYDGTTTRSYLNGVYLGSNTAISGNIGYSTNPVIIGADHGNSPYAEYFPGRIDEVRIYNRALSLDEISRLYKIQKPKVVSGIDNTGLIGYWPLNEGSGTRAEDASVSANNGTINGATWISGKNGKALSFNGTSNYVDLGDPSNFDFGTGDYTFSMWVYPRSSSSQQIFSKDGSVTGRQFEIAINGPAGAGSIRTTIFQGDNAYLFADTPAGVLTLNEWNHVTVVRRGNAAGMLHIYVNGIEKAPTYCLGGDGQCSNSAKTMQPTGTNLRVGARVYGGAEGYYNGLVDEVRVYSRALTDSEVFNLYKGSKATVVNKSKTDKITNGLVGYWTFDGSKMYGTTAYDSTSNAHYGLLINGPAPTIGKIGQALSFDGSNDYMVTNAIDFSTTQKMSVSFWLKQDSYANDDRLAVELSNDSNAGGNHNGSFFIDPNAADGTFTAALYGTGPAYNTATFTRPSAKIWHHYTFLFDRAKASQQVHAVYVDGVAQSLTYVLTNLGAGTFFRNDNIYVMARGGSSLFNRGSLDDLRIYNRLLSEDEVKTLYTMGK